MNKMITTILENKWYLLKIGRIKCKYLQTLPSTPVYLRDTDWKPKQQQKIEQEYFN